MKELQRLVIYAGIPILLIVVLASMASGEDRGGSVVGITAVIAVVVLPIIIGIAMAKREKRGNNPDTNQE